MCAAEGVAGAPWGTYIPIPGFLCPSDPMDLSRSAFSD